MVSVNLAHNSNIQSVKPQQTVEEQPVSAKPIPIGQTSEQEEYNNTSNINSEGTSDNFNISLDGIEYNDICEYLQKLNMVIDADNKTKTKELFEKIILEGINSLQDLFESYNLTFDIQEINKFCPSGYVKYVIKSNKDVNVINEHIVSAFKWLVAANKTIDDIRYNQEKEFILDVMGKLCDSGIDPTNYVTNNKADLYTTLGINEKDDSDDARLNKIYEYIINLFNDEDKVFDAEILRLILVSNDKQKTELYMAINMAMKDKAINLDGETYAKLTEIISGMTGDKTSVDSMMNSDHAKYLDKEFVQDRIKACSEKGGEYDIAKEELAKESGISVERINEIIGKLIENPDDIEGLNLNETEQKYLDTFKAFAGAQQNLQRVNLRSSQSQEEKTENETAITDATYRNYGESAYRADLIALKHWAENSDIEFDFSFDDLMNAATNDNYDIVVNDYINGTHTELNETVSAEATANNSDGVGYETPASSTNQSLADCQNNVQILQRQIAVQSGDSETPAPTREVHESKRKTSGIPEGILTANNIATYLKENNLSLKNFVIDVLTGSNKVFKDMNMRKYAANVYKTMMGKYEQIYCLENSKGGNIIALLIDNSKEGVLEKFGQGGKVAAGGFDITKMIAAAAKKEDEEHKEKHQNAAVC